MIRLLRVLSVILLLAGLAACGNKGDLIKPPASAPVVPAQS